MCEPTAWIMAATAIYGAMEADDQADAASAAEVQNYQAQQETMAVQQEEIRKQATDEMSIRAREAMIERGRLRTIQAESGAAGSSLERVFGESFFNESQDIASIESNAQARLRQSHLESRSLRARSQSKQNEIDNSRVSSAQLGLQIAGYGAEAYSRQLAREANAKSS